MRHGIKEHFRASMEPCLSVFRVIGRSTVRYGARVEAHVCSRRDDLSCPTESTTDVAYEMPEGPARAGGDRGLGFS